MYGGKGRDVVYSFHQAHGVSRSITLAYSNRRTSSTPADLDLTMDHDLQKTQCKRLNQVDLSENLREVSHVQLSLSLHVFQQSSHTLSCPHLCQLLQAKLNYSPCKHTHTHTLFPYPRRYTRIKKKTPILRHFPFYLFPTACACIHFIGIKEMQGKNYETSDPPFANTNST